MLGKLFCPEVNNFFIGVFSGFLRFFDSGLIFRDLVLTFGDGVFLLVPDLVRLLRDGDFCTASDCALILGEGVFFFVIFVSFLVEVIVEARDFPLFFFFDADFLAEVICELP